MQPLGFNPFNMNVNYHLSSLIIRWVGFFTLLLFMQCTHIEELLDKETPRESYIQAIKKTRVSETDIWKSWLKAADSSLLRPLPVDLPFQQKVLYFPDDPETWSWRMNVRQGRKVEISCVPVDSSHQLFLDIYIVSARDTALLVSTTDSTTTYVPDADEEVICRLQPELMIAGSATFSISDEPVLGFPVDGGQMNDIGSFWGDPRDGGARLHKGVDIFAPRGTPVVAAAPGRVRRIGNGGRGGKTVWLQTKSGSLYYAHLDSINTSFGQSVSLGDTLGFVGNTGNARTTPPHLHFGVYDHGAIDPMPFINTPRRSSENAVLPISEQNRWGRVRAANANVRPLPNTKQNFFATLKHNDLVLLRGSLQDWYHVQLADNREGYIHSSLVSIELTSLGSIQHQSNQSLNLVFNDGNFLTVAQKSHVLQNFGSFGPYTLTRFRNHWVGLLQAD